MARVDADDDGIDRFVLRHHAMDPERGFRRHLVVAAFDDEVESSEALRRAAETLAARRAAGERVDEREHFTVVHLPAGYAAEVNARRSGERDLRSRRLDGQP